MARATAKPRSRWHSSKWFFLVLAVLGATAVTIETWYNLKQQLTPQQLERARATWQQNGPRDYDLVYTVSRQTRTPDRIVVTFRSGTIASVHVDHPGWESATAPLYDLSAALTVDAPSEDGEVIVETGPPAPREYRVRVRHGRVEQVR